MRRSVHEKNASLPDFLTAQLAWNLEQTVEKTGCDGRTVVAQTVRTKVIIVTINSHP
jgi:hypothetical protein